MKTFPTSLLLALAYFATGRLGLMLPAFGSHITLIWLPTGIAVAALLRWGTGCWPGILLGAFAVNLATGTPWPTALGVAAGNTLGPLLAAGVLRRTGFHSAFDRARDILLLAVAATLGMLITSSFGVVALKSAGLLAPGTLVRAWLTWWAGDALGVIAAAPLILTFTRVEVAAILRRRMEFLIWLVATVLGTWAVFIAIASGSGIPLAISFLPLPFIAWAALRFGAVGTSLGLIILSVGAAYGTATLRGPFYRGNAMEEVVVLWLYMATNAVLGWLIAALHTARVQATGVRELFERALSDVSLGVLLAGLDRRITYANHGFTRLTGYTEAEALGQSCAFLQGPETDPATLARLKAALHGDGFFDGEILNYRKDGTTFWNGLLISPVRDERGAMTGFLGIQRDISKRKQAEVALHQSEEHLRTIIELEPECVKLLSPEGTLLEMNPAGLAMIEACALEEVRGLRVSELVTPEDRAAFAEMHRRVMQGATGRCEFAIVGIKGTRRILETHAVPYRNPQRQIIGVLAISRDITERRRTEEKLRESEERFRRLIDFAPEAVVLLDVTSGRFVQVNPAAERLFRRSAAELSEVGPMEMSPPTQPDGRPSRETGFEVISRAMAGETPVFEWTHRDADGRDIPCEVRLLRIEIGDRAVVRGSLTDITDRKAAEEALRTSEARYRKLFDANPHPMWVHDFETLRYLAVNDAAVAHYGYSREEFLAMTTLDVRPPEEVPALRAAIKLVEGGRDYFGPFRHRKRDGTLIDVEVTAHVINFDGRRAAVVLIDDVTERRRAEARSSGERAVLELLAADAPLPAVLDRLARSQEEIFPRMLCSVLLLDADGKHLRHGAAPSLPEAFYRTADGLEIGPNTGSCGTAAFTRQTVVAADIATDPRWKNARDLALSNGLRACWSMPLISSGDRVLGTSAIYYREPTSPRPEEIAVMERGAHFATLAIERHELLRSLQESQVRLQTLVGNLPGMAYRCQNDSHWTMTYVSEGCEAVTGYRRDELENNRVIAYAELIHPEDREALWAKCQEAALDAHTPCQNEYRIIDRSGRERWISERASGVYANDGALLAIDGFIQDITAARREKIEREKLDQKMQETQKLESLGVLAGGIAHDFNNLLTAILGNASMANLELTPGSSAQECVEQITEASMRAADLCKQMLAYSGRGRFVVHKLDLGELVEQTAQMLHISISKKAVLRYRLEKGLPPVEVDATQIRQVIMNLVINASEAIGDQSGVISISTGLTRVDRDYLHGTLMDPDLPEGEYVFLEVSDSGCGMSAATRAKIFDPFFTTKFTGRGLGLAAVLGIVRGHKGALKVYSELGRGTTFKLLFPAAAGATDSTQAPVAAIPAWQGAGTVLVVDDEETMRSIVTRMMRKMGLEAVLAADGREAVEIFRADPKRFAFVLLDLTMPHMDGEQTFTELRRLRPEVRVVLMSGFNAQEALVRFSGKGLASFLQKPFTIEALRSTVQTVLEGKNAGGA